MMAVKQFLEFSDLGHQEWFAARKKKNRPIFLYRRKSSDPNLVLFLPFSELARMNAKEYSSDHFEYLKKSTSGN